MDLPHKAEHSLADPEEHARQQARPFDLGNLLHERQTIWESPSQACVKPLASAKATSLRTSTLAGQIIPKSIAVLPFAP
jgi:hypothetical protein